jgi:hypothetical protein
MAVNGGWVWFLCLRRAFVYCSGKEKTRKICLWRTTSSRGGSGESTWLRFGAVGSALVCRVEVCNAWVFFFNCCMQ